jgi:hypothetical protein
MYDVSTRVLALPVVEVALQKWGDGTESNVKYPLPGLLVRQLQVTLKTEEGELEQAVDSSHQLTSIW